MIKIYWLCKNSLFTDAIEATLKEKNIFIVGISKTSQHAVEQFSDSHADILIMDFNWGTDVTSGVDLLKCFLDHDHLIKIIPVTNSFQEGLSEKLEQIGASGYFYKTDSIQNITDCIIKVFSGEKCFQAQSKP